MFVGGGVGNFGWNESKCKKLSPSSPCFASSFPPRGSRKAAEHFCRKNEIYWIFFRQGEALTKANSKRNVLSFVYVAAPHSSAAADTFPPRGSRKAADHFCRKKWSSLNFFQARGRLGKRKKFESTSIVCLRRHFPRYRRFFRAFLSQEKKRKRGKQERGLSIKRLFDEKMPDCCSVAPHHLASQGASPQGEAYEIDWSFLPKKILWAKFCARTRRYAPCGFICVRP